MAKEYLAAGTFLWNANLCLAKTIIGHSRNISPCLEHLRRIADNWETPQRNEVFSEEFAAIKGVSIDYAVLSMRAVIEAVYMG